MKLKTFKLTREYLIEAINQQEAEEIIHEAENDLDWLDQEWWEINKPLQVPSINYFIAEYRTYNGEHEYVERGVLNARSYEKAVKLAIKGKKLFVRDGWEEFCECEGIEEISKADFEILKK
jgi:hypothetical protein